MFNLKSNLNTLDRLLRSIIGVFFVLISFPFYNLISSELISMLSLVFGIVNILSGVLSWCVVYSLLGISTKTKES